jgi:rhamnose utilization protein RhaD (predicted bifunctional aldolase and dehydrogenase)/NAD(P)-dependent dehydrogenase (short-subunit alcohol dehydrogenase family)
MTFKVSEWDDVEATRIVEALGNTAGGADLAMRVYSTRLLGQDPSLVLHGGGNTSVKTQVVDFDGQSIDVLCVKGSGWDMGTIEPPGLPAVRMDALKKIAEETSMTDEDLVSLQRRALLDPAAPNPSIEAVLHAIVPEKYVDHSHANALISLTNQPDGEAIIRDLFPDAVIVPYVMPGFALARDCQAILQGQRIEDGMILLKHGLFTAADDAQQSYETHIKIIDRCMARIENGPARPFGAGSMPNLVANLQTVAPLLRGALSKQDPSTTWVMDHRANDEVMAFCNGEDLASYAQRGNATPDHSIRIKRFGVVLPAPDASDLAGFKAAAETAVADFARDYAAYFERNNARYSGSLTMLDLVPRVAYVPGIGLFGIGRSRKDAAICADIAEATVNAVTAAERVGTWAPLPEEDIFDVEYWSLEQAKLAGIKEAPFTRKVVAVTGAGSGLGLEIAKSFHALGAEVAMLDLDGASVEQAAEALNALAIQCDVSDEHSVNAAFDTIAERFGGIDVLISNAGVALQGAMAHVDMEVLEQSLNVNFKGALFCARSAIRIMTAQGFGGALLFNVSKQALNPGQDFGPYGISKSALLALVKQLATEHGADGITANAVNADRIRTGLLNEKMIEERAKARGVDPDTYMKGNLLKREVRASDVAEAFLYLAKADRTTGAILTVDGGNTAAMVR